MPRSAISTTHAVALVLGLGCASEPADSGPSVDTGMLHLEDKDRDGFPVRLDCDDTMATVHPGAIEHCDGVDEDCDGLVDNSAVDASAWFPDLDRDGWGSDAAIWSCAPPTGHVAQSGDCDDQSRSRSPGESERCNGRDDDCDGVVDEDCSG
jgi:hypothetical protein